MEKAGKILRTIFDNDDDVWFFIAPDYSILSFNNKAFENGKIYHNKLLKAGDNILDYARDTENNVDQTFISNFEKALQGRITKQEQQIQYGSLTIWTRSKYIPVFEKDILAGVSVTVEDITREKQMEQTQAKFQEEILLLSNKREEFINIASHELKTPLSSLKASVQIIEKLIQGDSNNLNIKPFINRANSSITKLTRLINDLLNVNKIESGELTLEKSAFQLSELIHSCSDHIPAETSTHHVQAKGDLELTVHADKDKIEQVLTNLVNNAVKYAPSSGEILITAEGHPDFVKIAVKDYGPGIPADKVNDIFKRYYRINTDSGYNSGMGLGLYISEEIIKRHGGKIGVETAEGQGCTFWFTLPVNSRYTV